MVVSHLQSVAFNANSLPSERDWQRFFTMLALLDNADCYGCNGNNRDWLATAGQALDAMRENGLLPNAAINRLDAMLS